MPEFTFQTDAELDDIDWQLLKLLEADARLSYRELGKHVSLTAPAVSKRVERLASQGILTGYRAQIDPSKIGLPLTAFCQVSVARSKSTDIAKQLQALPEVVECHRISGDYSYLLKVQVASVAHLESFIDRVGKFGHSSTSIVLSSRVKKVVAESLWKSGA